MKKHLQLILGILLVSVANLASAQTNANETVKRIVKSFRDKKNVELSFNYQYVVDASNQSDVQQGTAYLQGEAYKIILKEQQTISDGKTIWSYLVDDEEVMVSNATDGSDNTPLKLLTTLDKDYKANFTDKSTIILTNPEGQYKVVSLSIDPKNNTLIGMEIHADDGSKMVVAITELKFDQDLKPNFFTFDEKAYPNVDIIDMR
jgi:outer membrane lipoprotein-sorting protein